MANEPCTLCREFGQCQIGWLCIRCDAPLIACTACWDKWPKAIRDHVAKATLDRVHDQTCPGHVA